MIRFANDFALYLLLLVPVLIFFYWLVFRWKRRALARFGNFIFPTFTVEELYKRIGELVDLFALTFDRERFGQTLINLDQIVGVFAFDRFQIDDLKHFEKIRDRFVDATFGAIAFAQRKQTSQTILIRVDRLLEFGNGIVVTHGFLHQ